MIDAFDNTLVIEHEQNGASDIKISLGQVALLSDSLFRLFAVGDIGDHRQRAAVIALVVKIGRGADQYRQWFAVAAQDTKLIGFLDAAAAVADLLPQFFPVFLQDIIERIGTDNFISFIAEDIRQFLVDKGDAVIGFDDPHALTSGFDDLAILLFAFFELFDYLVTFDSISDHAREVFAIQAALDDVVLRAGADRFRRQIEVVIA